MILLISSFIINKELYVFKLNNPIIHLESKPRLLDGLNEKISLGLVSLDSEVSSGFLCVRLIGVSQSLVNEKMNRLFFFEV